MSAEYLQHCSSPHWISGSSAAPGVRTLVDVDTLPVCAGACALVPVLAVSVRVAAVLVVAALEARANTVPPGHARGLKSKMITLTLGF